MSSAEPKAGEKRKRDEEEPGASPSVDRRRGEDDGRPPIFFNTMLRTARESKGRAWEDALVMLLDSGPGNPGLFVRLKEFAEIFSTSDSLKKDGAVFFAKMVDYLGKFADKPAGYQTSFRERCMRFVECIAFLSVAEMMRGHGYYGERTPSWIARRAYIHALDGDRSLIDDRALECPLAKEFNGRAHVVFEELVGCLDVFAMSTARVIDLNTCDADVRGSGGDNDDEEAEEEEKKSAGGDVGGRVAEVPRGGQTAPVTERRSPVAPQGSAGTDGGSGSEPLLATAQGAVGGMAPPDTDSGGAGTKMKAHGPAAGGATIAAEREVAEGGAAERDTSSSADDVPMPAAAGGATSSEAAPQGPTLNTQGPAVEQRSAEQSARKRKSGAMRRNERKQRERVAGTGAAETPSTGSGSQEGSPESGGAASSKAAHNGATSKHTAPVLQSSSKQNAWQGGSRQWKQGQGSGTVPVVPKRAAATLRPRGPGPVYRYVGEGAPKGVPITASARAPLRAPAPVAARTSTVAPPASRVAGGAAESAAASQVTFLILSVISALQGLLVQNAGVGHGGEAGVVVEEGL